MEVKPVPVVDNWIHKAGKLTIGEFNFSIIETPGHTPGGWCYLIENRLFVGDTLFRGSVGRTDLPGGNWDILEKSLLYIMEHVDLDVIIYSGHGKETNLRTEKEKNPFLISLKSHLN
jgi:Zn-dependent hydrolases, including glyoxylases